MEELIKNTTNYLDYLIGDLKLCVSVHFLVEICEKIHGKVMLSTHRYMVHRNPYCLFVKEQNHEACLENQRILILESRDHDPVVHVCHAGVYEIVYPILKEGVAVGCVSVSGYRKGDSPSLINPALWQSALDGGEIPRALTDVLIPPLRIMMEKLVCFESEQSEEINLILRYIADNPHSTSLSEITRRFGRSRSHVSHLFKTKTGKTVRAYCNDLKLYRARELLVSTDLSVTEIALESGFEDTSYFISLFKAKYGTTPNKIRKLKD